MSTNPVIHGRYAFDHHVDIFDQPIVSHSSMRMRLCVSRACTDGSTNHPQLSPLEQEVLWEYAKLGDKTKRVCFVLPCPCALTTDCDDRTRDLDDAERSIVGRAERFGEEDGPCTHARGSRTDAKATWTDSQFKGSVFAILQEGEMKREEQQRVMDQQEEARQRAQQAEYEYHDRSQNPDYSMGSDGYY